MRVFLDTNVLVSAFTTRGICADVIAVVLTEHQLVVGETVLEELARVLEQKMGMPPTEVGETEELLRREGVVPEGVAEITIAVRDPDDVVVLGEAVQGAADVLVTGDQDLLAIAAESPVAIVSPRGFWEKLQARE